MEKANTLFGNVAAVRNQNYFYEEDKGKSDRLCGLVVRVPSC
jgi:hypothetical protein